MCVSLYASQWCVVARARGAPVVHVSAAAREPRPPTTADGEESSLKRKVELAPAYRTVSVSVSVEKLAAAMIYIPLTGRQPATLQPGRRRAWRQRGRTVYSARTHTHTRARRIVGARGLLRQSEARVLDSTVNTDNCSAYGDISDKLRLLRGRTSPKKPVSITHARRLSTVETVWVPRAVCVR